MSLEITGRPRPARRAPGRHCAACGTKRIRDTSEEVSDRGLSPLPSLTTRPPVWRLPEGLNVILPPPPRLVDRTLCPLHDTLNHLLRAGHIRRVIPPKGRQGLGPIGELSPILLLGQRIAVETTTPAAEPTVETNGAPSHGWRRRQRPILLFNSCPQPFGQRQWNHIRHLQREVRLHIRLDRGKEIIPRIHKLSSPRSDVSPPTAPG